MASRNLVVLLMLVPISILAGSMLGVEESTHRVTSEFAGLDSIALGINGKAVQFYDISREPGLLQSVGGWFSENRDGWRDCGDKIVKANVFIAGDLFQVNINDTTIAIGWARGDMKYRSSCRSRDIAVDELLGIISDWRMHRLDSVAVSAYSGHHLPWAGLWSLVGRGGGRQEAPATYLLILPEGDYAWLRGGAGDRVGTVFRRGSYHVERNILYLSEDRTDFRSEPSPYSDAPRRFKFHVEVTGAPSSPSSVDTLVEIEAQVGAVFAREL